MVRTGRLTAEGGVLRFRAAEEWAPMWTSSRTRAGFQAFKDLTALFAEECNIMPGDMRIFWVAHERAISWCRSTGALSRHDIIPPEEGMTPVVLAGVNTADLRIADTRARAELGR